MYRAMCRAACRPDSAAMSAVSAACTRLPGREHARQRRRERRVDGRPSGAGIHGQPGQPGQLVVGDPVSGKDHDLARHEPRRPGPRVCHLDALQPSAPGDPPHRAGGPHRHPPAHRRAEPERGVALLPLVLGGQRDHVGPGVRERHRGRERHVLGPDDQRPPGQPLPAQVHPLLQLAGGHDPGRAVTGDQPRRPRSFPAPGGEQHRRRLHRLQARRAGHRDRVRAIRPGRPAGHRGARPQLRARRQRRRNSARA